LFCAIKLNRTQPSMVNKDKDLAKTNYLISSATNMTTIPAVDDPSPPPRVAPPTNPSDGNTGTNRGNNDNDNDDSHQKYHALIVDSGAIIKQTSLSSFAASSSDQTLSLLNAAKEYYTVPAVLAEIRDPKSRRHLEEFELRLRSLRDTELRTRTPSREALAAVSEFARKTGDYPQLSNVDLQVLALTYDLEAEAAKFNGRNLDHVRREPKRVLGVRVEALSGDGRRDVKKKTTRVGDGSQAGSVAGSDSASAFFRGNADGIIDAAHLDLDYGEDDDDDDHIIVDDCGAGSTEERDDSARGAGSGNPSKPGSWAKLVNPQRASAAPPVDYSLSTSSGKGGKKDKNHAERKDMDLDLKECATSKADVVIGQFDDASEDSAEGKDEDAFSNASDGDGEFDAINIANANSDDEMSDEDCDVFVLEPHEAAYFKKLKEQKKQQEHDAKGDLEHDDRGDDGGGLESDFPSLADAAAVPYEGSDGEAEERAVPQSTPWQEEEEERKKKSLQPMINGRAVRSGNQKAYTSFRKYGNVVSAGGSAVAMEQMQKAKEQRTESNDEDAKEEKEEMASDPAEAPTDHEYKSRILGAAAAASASDFPSEMTAEDDDGEGWVTCAGDIRNMKATGSLHLGGNSHNRNGKGGTKPPKRKNAGPPVCQRAACATTDFAMQNVILQMNLELLSVDGVRVRRLKTWVTRCGACFTVYGNDNGGNGDLKKKGGGRLFCDKCGSNNLQRIAASVDKNTGRLKLHMRRNYRHNKRGTKFSLPKAGKVSVLVV